MIENKIILCDSNIPWYHNRYSKHHIMSRLAKRNRVIFINPQVGFFQYLRKVQYNPFEFLRRTGRPENESLEVFTPLAVPFRSKFDFVHKIDPWYFARQIEGVLDDIKPQSLILFLGNPWNLFLLDYFKDCACTVYHCSDNFPALFDTPFAEKVAKREKEMISRADLVIAVSEPLMEKCLALNSNSYLVKHGVDEHFYIRRNGPLPVPEDLNKLPSPIIGFVGSIDLTIDYTLTARLLMENSDKNFVFIGPVDRRNEGDFEVLKRNKNLYYLGKKFWKDLPAYIQNFDLCIIPWAINDFTKRIRCPLKLVEYLASGKFVISTLAIDEALSPAVMQANGKQEFSDLINEALQKSKLTGKALEISSLVKDWSWGKRVEELSRLIEDRIRLKGF
jgi:glycosyltransferase involved in cell wall biosynthesis